MRRLGVRARAELDCKRLPYPDLTMQLEFTAVYRKVPEGYVAFVEELPGANTQGATLEEARENLREAVELTLEANRALAEEDLAGVDVIREPLKLTA
jgi:predicted RNase H-like HicB family nuclease